MGAPQRGGGISGSGGAPQRDGGTSGRRGHLVKWGHLGALQATGLGGCRGTALRDQPSPSEHTGTGSQKQALETTRERNWAWGDPVSSTEPQRHRAGCRGAGAAVQTGPSHLGLGVCPSARPEAQRGWGPRREPPGDGCCDSWVPRPWGSGQFCVAPGGGRQGVGEARQSCRAGAGGPWERPCPR